jgi:Glycosyltransferase sugar-binding region containing DXD motif
MSNSNGYNPNSLFALEQSLLGNNPAYRAEQFSAEEMEEFEENRSRGVEAQAFDWDDAIALEYEEDIDPNSESMSQQDSEELEDEEDTARSMSWQNYGYNSRGFDAEAVEVEEEETVDPLSRSNSLYALEQSVFGVTQSYQPSRQFAVEEEEEDPSQPTESQAFDWDEAIALEYPETLYPTPMSLDWQTSDYPSQSFSLEDEPPTYNVEAFEVEEESEAAPTNEDYPSSAAYGFDAEDDVPAAKQEESDNSQAYQVDTDDTPEPTNQKNRDSAAIPVNATVATPPSPPRKSAQPVEALSDDDFDEFERATPTNRASDAEAFAADLAAILRGEKVYEPPAETPAPPPPAPESQTQPAPQSQAQTVPPKKSSPHDIFDQMGRNMAHATAFDLGTFSLEQRFDEFDRLLDEQESESLGYAEEDELSADVAALNADELWQAVQFQLEENDIASLIESVPPNQNELNMKSKYLTRLKAEAKKRYRKQYSSELDDPKINAAVDELWSKKASVTALDADETDLPYPKGEMYAALNEDQTDLSDGFGYTALNIDQISLSYEKMDDALDADALESPLDRPNSPEMATEMKLLSTVSSQNLKAIADALRKNTLTAILINPELPHQGPLTDPIQVMKTSDPNAWEIADANQRTYYLQLVNGKLEIHDTQPVVILTKDSFAQGFNATQKEKLLNRFADPYLVYSDPNKPSYLFKPTETPVVAIAQNYDDLQALDMLVQFVPNPVTIGTGKNARKVARQVTYMLPLKPIPNVMNFIWLGGPFTQNRGWAEVESFIKVGQVPLICLWTDVTRKEIQIANRMLEEPVDLREKGIWEMLNWCKQKNICLINVDEVFNQNAPMLLQPLFNLCRLHQHWGPASDIFRYELLYRFGGGYSDIDHTCLKSMSDFSLIAKPVPIAPQHQFAHCVIGKDMTKTPTMASLLSTQNNPILSDILLYIKARFAQTRGELAQLTATSGIFKLGFAASTESTTKEVLARTGPNAYYTSLINTLWKGKFQSPEFQQSGYKALEEGVDVLIKALYRQDATYANGNPDNTYTTNAKFIHDCCIEDDVMLVKSGSSWLTRRPLPPLNSLPNAKIALTVLLYDLRNNPGFLDLTTQDCTSNNLSALLEFIKLKFPNDMKVKEAWMLDNCAEHRRTAIANLFGWKTITATDDEYPAAKLKIPGYVLKL